VNLIDLVSLAVECGVIDLDELVRKVKAGPTAVGSS
jgi:hypothetical protein